MGELSPETALRFRRSAEVKSELTVTLAACQVTCRGSTRKKEGEAKKPGGQVRRVLLLLFAFEAL